MKKKKIVWEKITIKELAAIIYTKLQEHDIDCTLVGGACVSIYSKNKYLSYDLDFVCYENMRVLQKVLKELNFQKEGRHFVHKKCQFFVEFVSPPVAIGKETINEFELAKTKLGEIKMLTPTDSVKDRLSSFYHWNDWQALEQALMICKNKKIDIKDIKKWSKKEDMIDKFEEFKKHYVKLIK